MIQVTKGRGHESFESPDGKLLYFEDYGVKGLQSISTERTAWPGEGTLVLPSVRQAKWAVAEKGIYYVKFDDRSVFSVWCGPKVVCTLECPIQSSSTTFERERRPRLGLSEERSCSFSVTSDGRTIAWSQVDNAEGDIMMIEKLPVVADTNLGKREGKPGEPQLRHKIQRTLECGGKRSATPLLAPGQATRSREPES